MVVEVDGEREHVDGQGVGEGGVEITGAGALVDGDWGAAIEGAAVGGAQVRSANVLRAAAGLPCVLTGFTADLGLGLLPCEGGKTLWDAGGLDKVVGHVDEELEGQSEAVFDQACGEKDGLGGTEVGVAMADGAVAEIDGVAGGDHGVVGVGDGQRDKVIGALLERGRESDGDGADEMLEVGVGDARIAPHGVVNSVGSLGDGHLRGDFFGRPKIDLCVARHSDCILDHEAAKMALTKQNGGKKGGTVLGFPLKGFGLFTSLLLALAAAFFTFFATTTVAIFALLAWNGLGHHAVSYADSYRYVGFPAGLVVLLVALPVFGVLWVKGKTRD